MNEPVVDPLSLAAERRVDEACLRFEKALRSAQPARIEEYLVGAMGPEGDALLRELLRLEVDYRVRRGERPTVEEYQARFPTYSSPIAVWYPAEPTIGCSALKGATPPWPDVPGYVVVAELGRGAMGVVYKARHVALGRAVALKMILAGSHASQGDLARFHTEAEAVARLQHPDIVQIHEIGEHNSLPYVSFEYVDGGNLAARLEGAPLSDLEAGRLVELLAGTVHYAHGRRIVHRDLKPANILLTSDGMPKIADFGLAKWLDRDNGLTAPSAIVGTPAYMAPEQAQGKATVASDIYGLGAILYVLLTGQAPFGGTLPEILRQLAEESPRPPHVHNARVDRALEAVCLKCLNKEPKDRYPTAAALADDLARFRRGESVTAQSGTVTRWLGPVLRETRYTEVMRLWSGIWIGLAVNAGAIALISSLLLWFNVHDSAPYFVLWTSKLVLDVLMAWLLRIRGGPPVLPVERQLVQIWIFFWFGHFLAVWFYQRSGGDIVDFLPFVALECAVVLGSMAAILGGSFYVSAALCAVMAVLDAVWLGAGQVFATLVISPAFFWLGWKHLPRHSAL